MGEYYNTEYYQISKSTQSITKLENKHRVLPIGRIKGLTVDLDGVRTMADFEIIEIVDCTTPYPTLFGLYWAFDNQVIINLKTRKMTFESGEYRFIAPLDPLEE
jgi:hypothetical protein